MIVIRHRWIRLRWSLQSFHSFNPRLQSQRFETANMVGTLQTSMGRRWICCLSYAQKTACRAYKRWPKYKSLDVEIVEEGLFFVRFNVNSL